MFSKVFAICATLAVANAGNLYAGQQLAYSAPALQTYAAPIAKVAYSSAPAVSSVYQSSVSVPAKTLAYAAPATYQTYSAPAIHQTYAAPAIQTYAAPAIHQTYAAPALHTTYAAPSLQTYAAPLAKVAYSSAPSVSQVYSSIASPSIAYAPSHIAAYSAPAIGSTHQSTIRSFDGTVSHHSKAIDTAFSSVRKSDTRISNNLYTPALATKTISYAAPLATKTYAAPLTQTYAAPLAQTYATSYASPAVYSSAPAVLAPKAAISYSAAPIVSHVSFEGIGAQYAW